MLTKQQKEEFKLDYPNLSIEELGQKYNMKRNNIYWHAHSLGVHKTKNNTKVFIKHCEVKAENPKDIKYVPYPSFEIAPFKAAKIHRDEEDIVVFFSDRHNFKLTSTYNPEVCEQRTNFLLDSLMSIINLHRPIKRAWIINLGDNIQGENIHQGSKIDSVKSNVFNQIMNEACLESKFITSVSQGVEEVKFIGIKGNHGRYDPLAPEGTNWDLFLYDKIKDSLQNQKNITVDYTKSFYALINIKGFRIFAIHGDQCRGNAGVPLIAMRRKMAEWYALVGGFNYAYSAHFHTHASDTVNSHADYTICPPMVTGDEWAIETIGRASQPQQLCIGIHSKYGRSFQYTLHTDTNYLPNKFNDNNEGIINI